MEVVHKVLPNNELLLDLIKLVNEGQRVILPVKGNSMLPFIIGGRESVELVKPKTVAVGDVVLAWINGCRFVVHRIIRIEDNQVPLMGIPLYLNAEFFLGLFNRDPGVLHYGAQMIHLLVPALR